MDPEVERLVGRTWADTGPWRFLTRLTEAGDRLGGHPGEHRAADLVAEALRDAGGDPAVEPFEMTRWTRGRTEFAVGLDRDSERVERSFEAVALPYCPAAEVRGGLVDAGHGTPEELDAVDVAGRIVVARAGAPRRTRYAHRMEKFGHAVVAGAAGFVFVNDDPGQLPPTGALRFGEPAAVPGVGVSRETGAWLADYADAGAEATLSVDATVEPGTSHNVVCDFGPTTEECVLLVAHLDAHDVGEGALDNGCGLAVAVTAARLLASLDLDRRVRVAAVGCEETGLLGAEALADGLDPSAVAAVVNVDGAGRARNLRAYTHGSDDVEALAREVVADAGQPLSVQPTPHPYSDHWPFLRAGVPCLQLHSEAPTEGRAVGGGRGRGWTHTAADTRDKVDVRDLRSHAALAALLVRAVAAADLDRRDPTALAAELREADAEPGMRAAGLWPDGWE